MTDGRSLTLYTALASAEVEPAGDDPFLLRRARDAAVGEGPVGGPHEREPLPRVDRQLLVVELGAARVVHVVEVRHEHEVAAALGLGGAGALGVEGLVAP